MLKLAIAGGSGKDKKKLPADLKWWWDVLDRVQTDVFFYTNSQTWSRLIGKPLAMGNTAIAMGTTATQFVEWMIYSAKYGELYPNEVQQERATPYLRAGEPKIIKSLIGWVPLGGALSWALTQRMWLYNNQDFTKWLEKQNIEPGIINGVKNMLNDGKSKQEVSDDAGQYDAIMKEYMIYMMGQSMTPEQLKAYSSMMNYYDEIAKQMDNASKALMYEQMKDIITQGDPKFLDTMHEKAVEITRQSDRNKYRSIGTKKEYMDKSLLELNKK